MEVHKISLVWLVYLLLMFLISCLIPHVCVVIVVVVVALLTSRRQELKVDFTI